MSTQESGNAVLRTVGYWKQFYANNKKETMLLNMIIHEQGWAEDSRVTYEQISSAMALRGNKCLHDTDKCVHNTRRDVK